MKNLFLNTVPCLIGAWLLLGSTHILHAQSNNNMGIGTTSPDASAILDIKSTTKGLLIPRLTQGQENALSGPASGLLIFNTGQGRLNFYNAGWKPVSPWSLNGSNAYYSAGNVETTGNLLLNNASPTLYLQDTDNKSGMIHQNSNTMFFLTGSGNNSTTWVQNGSFWPLTLNMTNDAATFGGPAYFMEGNVGIGTTNPLSKLSISPSATEPKITLWDGGSTVQHYGFGVSGGQLNYHVDIAASSHVFYAGGKNGDGTELMRIKGNGRVGIGTNDPKNELTVSGRLSVGPSYVGSFAPPQGAIIQGNVGIGTTDPGLYKLHVRHNIAGIKIQHKNLSQYWGLTQNATTLHLGMWNTNGNVGHFDYASGNYFAISDRRLKDKISPLTAILPSLMKLQAKSYTFKSDPEQKLNIGFIAQDVKKLFPELISPPSNTEQGETPYMMNYAGFGIIAVQAIQEQQQIIESQAKKIEAQQAEIDAIKKALEKAGIKLD